MDRIAIWLSHVSVLVHDKNFPFYGLLNEKTHDIFIFTEFLTSSHLQSTLYHLREPCYVSKIYSVLGALP